MTSRSLKFCLLLLIQILAFTPAIANAEYTTTLSVTLTVPKPPNEISGIVFEDVNQNGTFEPDSDKPLPGVGVSDGERVVLSQANGKYVLPASRESHVVFI